MNSAHLATEIFDFAANEAPVRPSRSWHTRRVPNCRSAGSRTEAPMNAPRFADDFRIKQTLQSPDIAQLRQTIRGDVVLPNAPGYDQARKVWNGMVDKRPAAVIYCAGPDDVIAAVNFTRSRNFLISVRAGGHNVAGSS